MKNILILCNTAEVAFFPDLCLKFLPRLVANLSEEHLELAANHFKKELCLLIATKLYAFKRLVRKAHLIYLQPNLT